MDNDPSRGGLSFFAPWERADAPPVSPVLDSLAAISTAAKGARRFGRVFLSGPPTGTRRALTRFVIAEFTVAPVFDASVLPLDGALAALDAAVAPPSSAAGAGAGRAE
jgi:hypothetical protein